MQVDYNAIAQQLNLPFDAYAISIRYLPSKDNYLQKAGRWSMPVPMSPMGVKQGSTVTITAKCYEYPDYGIMCYDSSYENPDAFLGSVSDGETKEFVITSGYLYIYAYPGYIADHPYVAGSAVIMKEGYDNLVVSVDGNCQIEFYYNGCFIRGTMISLADGSSKRVEEITYDDDLLVYDFNEGRLAIAKPSWIQKKATSPYWYRVTFDDESMIGLVGSNGNCHRLYNMDKHKFLYANECIGDLVYTIEGPKRVMSCEKVEESIDYYNLTTENYYDCFANGVLAGSRLNNMYEINDEMKYCSTERLISEEEEKERWEVREKRRLPYGESNL